jgi:hypothetical protein
MANISVVAAATAALGLEIGMKLGAWTQIELNIIHGLFMACVVLFFGP